MVDERKLNGSVKIVSMVLLAIIMLFTGLGNDTAEANPSVNNPDAGKSGSIDYIRKSDFVGDGQNQSRGIFPGDRGEGYTCWAYGNVPDRMKEYSYSYFYGNTNRAKGGLGDEAFVETHAFLDQCNNGNKLLEYEIFAGDAYKGSTYEPVIDKNKELLINGWGVLGGFYHHDRSNSSTYVVAVEQVNGKNTTRTDGVYIERAKRERGVDMTSALQFRGLPNCYHPDGANGDRNRFRGSYAVSDQNVYVDKRYGFPYRATITQDGNKYKGNKYDVYGYGCNFEYKQAGFQLNLELDELFSDLTEEKDYKLYLVKRVHDMVVSAEMAIPNDTTEYKYGLGTMRLDGNAREGNDTVIVNRTGISMCTDFKWGTGCIDRYGGANTYLNYGERVKLLNIESKDGNASIYTIQRSNGQVFKHLANYFSYPNDNRGAVLSYKPDRAEVDVNHYDILTCGDSIEGSKWVDLDTKNKWVDLDTKNLSDCSPLREKDGGNIADKGTGEYTLGKTARFYAYNDGELYRTSRSQNYVLYDSSKVMSDRYKNLSVTKDYRTLNFFYADRNDLHTFRVNYKDTEDDSLLYGKDKDNGDSIRGYIQYRNILKGNTVEYKNPQTIVTTNNRIYERVDGSHTGTSSKVTGNSVIDIEYQKQPQVTVRYINMDNDSVFKRDTHQIRYGDDFNVDPNEVYTVSGTEYHLYELGLDYSLSNVTSDETIDVYYKDSPPLEYPEDRYEYIEDGTEGGTDVGEFSWRLNEDTLDTNVEMNFGGTHADADEARISQYVGTGDISEQSSEFNEENGMFTVGTADVMGNESFVSENDFNKDTTDKYQVNVEYDYTNIIEYNYVCDDGTEDRCFNWEIDEDNPNDPYWGDGDVGNNVTIEGTTYEARQTYEGNLELDIENSLGEEFTLEEVPESMVVGKGVDEDISLYNGDVSNNLIDSSHPSVTDKVEEISVEPYDVGVLETQSSVTVEETLSYDNTFGEGIPEPKEESRYLIGDIDSHLFDTMEVEEIDEEDYVVSEMRLDEDVFKLDDVFALSNKYGVQLNVDYDEVVDDELVIDERLVSVLEELELGSDEVVNVDYSKSRYFVPVDDTKYNAEYEFSDIVELNSLGLNEIQITYTKEFGFEDYLYGNVMDDPIYSEQKDSAKKVDYVNSESFTQEEMKALETEPERKGKINMFRATDDNIINSFLNE